MRAKRTVYDSLDIAVKLVRYNFKIIFSNKFVYFCLAAVLFYIVVTVIRFLDSYSAPNEGTVYNLLLMPGILLVFYPATFGIQNDVDSRMLETLFGIPNYRYKVWLVRLALIYAMVFIMLTALSLLSTVAVTDIPVAAMVFQLMFPIFFLGSLAFMFSTVIRSGSGTAVLMVVIGMALWISIAWLSYSRWNVFLNPFNMPSEINETVWADIRFNNRLYLSIGTVLAVLYGLLNLQKREKFV
jgi:hypothetical protein